MEANRPVAYLAFLTLRQVGPVVVTQKLDRDWQTEGVFRVEELEETKKALSKSGESAEPGNEWLP